MTGTPVRRFLTPALLLAVLVSPSPAFAQNGPAISVASPDKPDVAWAAVPIDELRRRAHADDVPAMEELGRRLMSGVGVPLDHPSGAAWFRRAADAGSPTAAFTMGVLYERGFVVERNAGRAVEWYRKAADAGVGPAEHNLALLLRDGKGAPQDGPKAVELLRSAARHGMTASAFALGDLYEHGGAVLKDPAAALAWFAITSELELQANHGTDTPLSKAAQSRGEDLQRTMTAADRERADQIGQVEFQQIVAALQPKPTPPPPATPPAAAPPQASALEPSWPAAPVEQVRLVQQALIDLQRLRGKADGAAGPATRLAIREFEKSAGLPSTGEPSRDVYLALVRTLGQRDVPQPPSTVTTGGWPAKAPDQIRAIQQLLIELKFLNAEPTGTVGPLTRRAIRDYQKKAGLKETGEPSQALFESLKSARAKAGG
jgi:peptidoglycan hydrolase-like protein with peptidoglycan-binding domain